MPRVAVMTKAYQERTMLPLWVRHYEKLVGRENLLVLDHGSSPAISIGGVRTERLPRGPVDEYDYIEVLSVWQRKLLSEYDWVITTDTDEFIVPNPQLFSSLTAMLRDIPSGTRRCVGCEVIDPGAPTQPLDWSLPILRQRPLGVLSKWSSKPAVSSVPTDWMSGLHTAHTPSIFDHALWLFHLKYADEQYLMERLALTRALDWSARSVAEGLGRSHRVPDIAMRRAMEHYRSTIAPGTLDDVLSKQSDPDTLTSPMMAIPDVFLDCL